MMDMKTHFYSAYAFVLLIALFSMECSASSKSKTTPLAPPPAFVNPGDAPTSNPAEYIDKPIEELQKLPLEKRQAIVNIMLRWGASGVAPEKTVERMRKALVLAPDAIIAHLHIARALNTLKKPEESYQELQELFKAGNLPLGIYLQAVDLLFDLGQLDEAEQKAKPLTEGKPPYGEGMHLYAEILQANGKLKESEAMYRKIITLKTETGAPEFKNPAGAKLRLGEILLKTGRYDEAEKWLLEAADTFRTVPKPFQRLTELYIAKKDTQKARRFLAMFKEKGGDAKVYSDLQKKIG
ncbi:MAG: tetratricopeptide repeat protein [bacterium]